MSLGDKDRHVKSKINQQTHIHHKLTGGLWIHFEEGVRHPSGLFLSATRGTDYR